MADTKHNGHLGAVYAATDQIAVAAAYDKWAETYEEEMRRAGYRHPSIALALLARHLPPGAGPVLDAGAGTGMIGEWMGIVGYPDIEALDISAGMLAVAARKGVYTKLHTIALGGVLPFETGIYAGIICTGVFTTGHVGADALAELVRITRPGGVIVATVKGTVWEGGFAAEIVRLSDLVTLAEETAPYVSMPGEAVTSPSRAIVLRLHP
jgi:predicted TPR repeat methyltransferase